MFRSISILPLFDIEATKVLAESEDSFFSFSPGSMIIIALLCIAIIVLLYLRSKKGVAVSDDSDLLNQILHGSVDSVCAFDVDGKIHYHNHQFAGYWGELFSKEGNSFLDLFDSDERNMLKNSLRNLPVSIRLKGNKQVRSTEWRISKSESSDLFFAVGHDITLRRNLEKEVEGLAIFDPLHRIVKYRTIIEVARQEHARSIRYNRNMSVMVISIDELDYIVEAKGKRVFDNLVRTLLAALQSRLRRTDSIGYYTENRFTIILPEVDAQGVLLAAQRMRQMIELLETNAEDIDFGFTISIGISALRGKDDELESIFERAETSLKKAEEGGASHVGMITE